MENMHTEENLYDFVFHYNPYEKVWHAIPRESQHLYWNGKPSDEIIKFLKKISKTALPQPLEYLITDTSRKHGKLRVGGISTYLRCEDPAIIAQILTELNKRRIAKSSVADVKLEEATKEE